MDVLQRFIFDQIPVRGEYIFLKDTYQEILSQYPYPPVIHHLLSEALCVAGLLRAIIKFDGRLTVQFQGKGKLKLLLAQCNSHFEMRGLVKWEGDLPADELESSFEEGTLSILVDSGSKNRYQGIVKWQGNSLAESVEAYFRESEQLATRLWLAADNEAAAGFLLQVIPEKEDKTSNLEVLHPEADWKRIVQSTEKIQPQHLLSMTYEGLLNHLYANENVRIFSPTTISFNCTCSRKRSEDAIYILGREEAEEELKHKKKLVVTCDFCHKQYFFERTDVESIFGKMENPPSQTRH